MSERKVYLITFCVLFLAAFTLGACGGRKADTPPPPFLPEDTEPLVVLAKLDLMQKKDAEPDQIETISVDETEFEDASLGVPEPGQSYAQMIIPGYIIILEYQDELYQYHASSQRVVQVPDQP
jgi:hypothetical protein